jgi:uncharacterized integral membrane protein
MDRHRGRVDVFWLVAGVIILFVGGYYLLRNTFGVQLPELEGDMIWPILIIALGASILVGVARGSRREEPKA